jgi:hypothetical protein
LNLGKGGLAKRALARLPKVDYKTLHLR